MPKVGSSNLASVTITLYRGNVMQRTRDYHRKMRAKHIRRKKNIVSHHAAFRVFDGFTYYKHDGMFSKGKIHLSCTLCEEKAYYGKHVPTMYEKRNYM